MGNEFGAYEYLGAHISERGVTFRTYAPNALEVSVIGDFNDWTPEPMRRLGDDGNFFEITLRDARPGMRYKYRIYRQDGRFLDHCDPYGFGMEPRPNTASIIRDLSKYKFGDSSWMNARTDRKSEPLNIYEIHLGSWRTKADDGHKWYTYSEIADELIGYVKRSGYNYIEFMPLSEHPCDESWGYQITGFFAPTSRYGTAAELMELVDKCHQNDIGVIMDFVPVHFAVDDYGLADYDGTALYEYPEYDVGYSEWGSKNFIHSRGEVRSFLKSAAYYWLKEYHFDGLRMDAICNMIYWMGDKDRGVNNNAVQFLRELNGGLKALYPSVMLFAEDSTSFPQATSPNGLGFDYKWDMGWMNDTLEYFSHDTNYRKDNYNQLTFSMMYYYDENFILPLSHDETVHGKGSIVQKMNGCYDSKFRQARATYLYMYAHPGKKLTFMGNEIGQLREWDEKREQDWDLLKYPIHNAFYRFICRLNHIYLSSPALWSRDFDRSGFEWIDCSQNDKCVYIFMRADMESGQKIIAVFNFSDEAQDGFDISLPGVTALIPLISSHEKTYGGDSEYRKILVADEGGFKLNIPAFSGVLFDAE